MSLYLTCLFLRTFHFRFLSFLISLFVIVSLFNSTKTRVNCLFTQGVEDKRSFIIEKNTKNNFLSSLNLGSGAVEKTDPNLATLEIKRISKIPKFYEGLIEDDSFGQVLPDSKDQENLPITLIKRRFKAHTHRRNRNIQSHGRKIAAGDSRSRKSSKFNNLVDKAFSGRKIGDATCESQLNNIIPPAIYIATNEVYMCGESYERATVKL
ncbi:expressed protein [Phakopsora pachyrhizi]|uniref:Expressed protein n=1 Tax=Phakopsora pachyrhizi TaxID=170000 RepID=A0AAV0B5V2_PHAPC|nr:expressed protein [Phakopsora pachyrhizi]